MSGTRCRGDGDPLFEGYHDEEWGFPVLDERGLFENSRWRPSNPGSRGGPSFAKRDAFRAAFAGFYPDAVASFGDADVERLLADPSIVRNRATIGRRSPTPRTTVGLRATGEPLERME